MNIVLKQDFKKVFPVWDNFIIKIFKNEQILIQKLLIFENLFVRIKILKLYF